MRFQRLAAFARSDLSFASVDLGSLSASLIAAS